MGAPARDDVAALMPQLREELAHLVAIPSLSEWGFPDHTREPLVRTYDSLIGLMRSPAAAAFLTPSQPPRT